jgi:hypothetical protein
MTKYNVEHIISDTKYSEFVYSVEGTLVRLRAPGRGAPAKTKEIDGKTGHLVGIMKFGPAPRPARAKAAPKETTPEPIRTTVQGTEKKVELIYSDGTVNTAGRGRPAKVLDNDAYLVEIKTTVPGGSGKKGRAPVLTVTEHVQTDAGIFYVYGGQEFSRKTVVPGAGAPPKLYQGKTLEKIIKRVLTPDIDTVETQEEEEEVQTLSQKGWTEGTKIKFKGSEKIGTVVHVREEYLSVSFPGDKFLHPVRPSKRIEVL